MDASFLFLYFQRTVTSILVCLETNDSLRADVCIMDNARRQIQPVACFQGKLLTELGESKRNTSLHHIDHLIIGMRVRGVDVIGTV